MIKYSLGCGNGHLFEAWFASSSAYDHQAFENLLSCPECGAVSIEKQPMAPALLKTKLPASAAPAAPATGAAPKPSAAATASGQASAAMDALRSFARHVAANTEDVGTRFAEEALRMHYGETEARAIRGETTLEDANRLHEEGVPFGVVPTLPEDHN